MKIIPNKKEYYKIIINYSDQYRGIVKYYKMGQFITYYFIDDIIDYKFPIPPRTMEHYLKQIEEGTYYN